MTPKPSHDKAEQLDQFMAQFGFQPDMNLESVFDHYLKLPTHEWITNETATQILALVDSRVAEAHTQGMIDGLDMGVKILKKTQLKAEKERL